MAEERFDPLIFLMSLGAGGIAVIPFAFLQYTFEHGAGLIRISDIGYGTMPIMQQLMHRSLEAVMVLFSSLHIILSLVLIYKLSRWVGSDQYHDILSDPLRNPALLAPFISIIMTMNVFIGPVRYFLPIMAENLQALMLPALVFWMVIWIALIRMDTALLKISFEKSFDVDRISFGWLLHPFALGMLTVTGMGIAAMAEQPSIAHTAAFMSLVSGSMGLFLFAVKLIAIFKSHFSQEGLPERQFLPSFMIVIPNVTLFGISAFRFGHYLEHQFSYALGPFFLIVMTLLFAFETWYIIFGMTLLKDYFSDHFFSREFYVTQWGFVCPVVAYAVLGSFVYKVFVPSSILYMAILATLAVAVLLFIGLSRRQALCSGILKKSQMSCF